MHRFDWKRAARSLVFGLVGCAIVGLVFGLVQHLSPITVIRQYLPVGLVVAVSMAAFNGFDAH